MEAYVTSVADTEVLTQHVARVLGPYLPPIANDSPTPTQLHSNQDPDAKKYFPKVTGGSRVVPQPYMVSHTQQLPDSFTAVVTIQAILAGHDSGTYLGFDAMDQMLGSFQVVATQLARELVARGYGCVAIDPLSGLPLALGLGEGEGVGKSSEGVPSHVSTTERQVKRDRKGDGVLLDNK